MKTDKISFGMALYKISNKSYKIGGQALRDAEPILQEYGKTHNVQIIPKKGFLTKIEGLIIFMSKIGEKNGQWVSLSKDPKKYLPVSSNYITVEQFTKDNITNAAKVTQTKLTKGSHLFSKASAALLPADSILLVKRFRK